MTTLFHLFYRFSLRHSACPESRRWRDRRTPSAFNPAAFKGGALIPLDLSFPLRSLRSLRLNYTALTGTVLFPLLQKAVLDLTPSFVWS